MTDHSKHSDFYKTRRSMYDLRDDMYAVEATANGFCRAAIKIAGKDPSYASELADKATAK